MDVFTLASVPAGFLKELLLVSALQLGVLVAPHEDGPEEAAVDGGQTRDLSEEGQ